MFGTMALVLPSRYEGGALAVSHAGATREFDYSKEGAYGTHYLGFYADCKHEIRPVTSGHRLALVYNLVQTGGGAAAGTFSPAANFARLDGALSKWELDEQGPKKLVHVLQHRSALHALGRRCCCCARLGCGRMLLASMVRAPLLFPQRSYTKAGQNIGDLKGQDRARQLRRRQTAARCSALQRHLDVQELT